MLPLPDSELVRQTRQGDDAAYGELVRRHQGLVYNCAYRVMGNARDAQEVTQDTFVRFYRYLAQYDERRDLRGYLATIATNVARTVWQRRQRFPGVSLEAEAVPEVPDQNAEVPGTALAAGELRAALIQAVDRLPGRLREVCSLFYLAEMSCRDVAEALSMNENAVKVALHRARNHLFVALKPVLDGGVASA
jgi:RNA polymerase sigma-70 factor (ECF subfamily)